MAKVNQQILGQTTQCRRLALQAHLLCGLGNLVHGLLGGLHCCEFVSGTAQGAREKEEQTTAVVRW